MVISCELASLLQLLAGFLLFFLGFFPGFSLFLTGRFSKQMRAMERLTSHLQRLDEVKGGRGRKMKSRAVLESPIFLPSSVLIAALFLLFITSTSRGDKRCSWYQQSHAPSPRPSLWETHDLSREAQEGARMHSVCSGGVQGGGVQLHVACVVVPGCPCCHPLHSCSAASLISMFCSFL